MASINQRDLQAWPENSKISLAAEEVFVYEPWTRAIFWRSNRRIDAEEVVLYLKTN